MHSYMCFSSTRNDSSSLGSPEIARCSYGFSRCIDLHGNQ